MTLRPRDLIYVPHGGARLGKQVAIVGGWTGVLTYVRRWHPKLRAFGPMEAVLTETITDLVPQTDRRWPAIKKVLRVA